MAWDWDKLQEKRKPSQPPPPAGGGGQPPQLDDLLEKMKGVKLRFPGGAGLVTLLIVLLLWGSSCVFTVAADEVGVVQRFGSFARISQPGLNFKLPRGVESVTKVKVRYVFKEEFGLRTLEAAVKTRYAAPSAYEGEALMLTGDLNVAVVPWIVQYRINDPYKYLFKVSDVISTLRDLAESTMRLVVGDRSINEVISKREEIATANRDLLQKELDVAETGIKVVAVELKKTNVPDAVQPSFNEVNQAIQEKEKMIYQAREAYNKAIPAARGDAEKTIRSAEGYALDRVNRAQGDVARFAAVREEYVKAKDVTRKRIYLETMEEVLPEFGGSYIVDGDLKGILPLLNLDKKSRRDEK